MSCYYAPAASAAQQHLTGYDPVQTMNSTASWTMRPGLQGRPEPRDASSWRALCRIAPALQVRVLALTTPEPNRSFAAQGSGRLSAWECLTHWPWAQ